MDNWKTLSTRKIFKNRYALLEEDIVLTPKGKKISYICAGRGSHSIRVVPVSENKKIFLIYQFRYPHKKYFWELPGGRVDKKEKPEETVLRELEEETSVRAKKLVRLGRFAPSPGIQGHIKHIFLAENVKPIDSSGSRDHDDAEFIQKVKSFSLDEILEMIKEGEIWESSTVLSILLYRDYLNRKKK